MYASYIIDLNWLNPDFQLKTVKTNLEFYHWYLIDSLNNCLKTLKNWILYIVMIV
jgi:hypothetical protein